MSSEGILIYDKIKSVSLPKNNGVYSHSFLTEKYLDILETINPCEQRYYILGTSLVVKYRLKINVLNFYKSFNLRIPVQIIGLPFSLARQGFYGEIEEIQEVVQSIKGFKVILNCDEKLDYAKGYTLSTFKLIQKYKNFDEYLGSMRSHYRYRINKALEKSKDLYVYKLENRSNFDSSLYKLYLEVYNNSNDKLECLDIDFFRKFPGDIYIFQQKESKEKMAFVHIIKIKHELIFLFGGFNRQKNREYDLFYNMLLFIVKKAINMKCKIVDFGQTAEDTKKKIGCIEEKKYLYAHHSNILINTILKRLLHRFSYKPKNHSVRVFKDRI